MGKVKVRKLNIKMKIALVYSLVALVIVILSVLFMVFALQYSMKNQPVTSYITSTKTSQVKITDPSDKNSVITYEVPVSNKVQMKQYSISESQLNTFLSSEVFKRLLRYAFLVVLVILVIILFLSYFLSKWLLKPLTAMAETTGRITADNLDMRLEIPETDDELRKLSGSFNQTLNRLQTSFQDMERLNAYASHELKNALAVMKTRLEVDFGEEDCKEIVRFATEQVDRITRTINDILAMSFSRLKDSDELVDLALAAAKVVDEYKVTGRPIRLEIPEEGVLPVRGKEIWFQRVIANLVDNAVKYSGSDCAILLKVKQCFDAVILSVSDKGRGISGDARESVWEPYFREGDSDGKGFGLGLAMVHHVVDICGGLVWLDSSPEEGSTFYISLPAVRG